MLNISLLMKRCFLLLTLILSTFLVSCEKVSELSDSATITAFKVNNQSVAEIVLATPIVRNDSIILPVSYGKYMFPLTLQGTPTLEGDRAKILNINFAEEQTFDEIDSFKVFYVSAASGATKKWVICFEALASSEETDITGFEIESITPSDFLMSAPVFRKTQSAIYMMAIEGTLPVTIVPKVTTSPGSTIIDYKAGDPIKFSEYDKLKEFTVKSESGQQQQWYVGLYKAVAATDGVTSPEILARLNIAEDTFKSTVEPTTSEYEIKTSYFDGRDIRLIIQKKGATIEVPEAIKFPIKVVTSFEMDANSQSVGLTSGEVMTFNSLTDIHKFYTIDNLSATYANWTIRVTPFSNNEANVNSFTINSYSSAGNLMELSKNVEIDKQKAIITIPITKVPDAMPLTVSATAEISAGATFGSPFPPTMVFDNISATHEFVVISSLETERKTWKVVLRDDSNLSDKAEVLSFKVNAEYPRDAVYLEPGKAQITIVTQQNTKTKFVPTITISEGASLSGITSGAELEVSFAADKTFDVVAKNGTAKQWRIKMIYAPQVKGSALTALEVPWSSANNNVVTGTTVAKRGSVDVIRMETKEQNTVIYGYLMAAGSLFTGSFDFKLTTEGIDYPRIMTKFGMPFTEKPIEFSLDMKYVPGAQLKQASKRDPNSPTAGGNPWSISNIAGSDQGQIWVDVINYNGDISQIPNAYSGEGRNGKGQPIAGLTVLGRGEIVTPNTNGWVDGQRMSITYSNPTLPTTHIAIVMSSSIRGDKYIGAPGSILETSNFSLIYYKPDADAIRQ